MSTEFRYRRLATKSTVRLIKLRESTVEGRMACTMRYVRRDAQAAACGVSLERGHLHAPEIDLRTLLTRVTGQQFKSQRPHDRVYGILRITT